MKGLAYIDRGAVLFVGMAVGAVLLYSFEHDGKVLEPLFAGDAATLAAPAVAAPVPAQAQQAQVQPQGPAPVASPAASLPFTPPKGGCGDDFPRSARVTAALRESRPITIGVLGDSFGDGIWAATNQNFRNKKGFKVTQWSKEGIGFTRYRSLDLLEDAKSRFADHPIDIAIVDFGANDTQGVWEGGHGFAYMTPRWQKAIGGRVEALVSYLQGEGVAVAWIGLPRMRKADYDSQVQSMNAFYTGLMCRLHVPFVNPLPVSEDKDHHFAKELIDPVTNKSYNARAEDGIHMTFHGYSVIARPVWQRIEALAPPSVGAKQPGAAK
jgi:hypothetical protein